MKNNIDIQLGIPKPPHADPHHRAIVERFFATVNEQLLRTLSQRWPPNSTLPDETTGPNDGEPPSNDPDA